MGLFVIQNDDLDFAGVRVVLDESRATVGLYIDNAGE
jgi:hypothetical protein